MGEAGEETGEACGVSNSGKADVPGETGEMGEMGKETFDVIFNELIAENFCKGADKSLRIKT